MKASHAFSAVWQSFDEPNLVARGLLTAAVLTGTDRTVGADRRRGDTIGSWLRAFTHGNVRQLNAVSRQLRCRLWAAGAGPHRLDERLFIDADSTIALAYGPAKQGVSFGYIKQRALHPLIAIVLDPGSTQDVLHTRLREGKANTARGAASFIAESISRARTAGGTAETLVRLDGGFYNAKVIEACQRADVRFSVTVHERRPTGTLRTTSMSVNIDACRTSVR